MSAQRNGSIWMNAQLPSFGPLDRDLAVDVAVIGAGLTGITTAYLLAREGRRVALFDRGRLAAGDTGRSTAHLTCVTDLPLHQAADRLGEASARAYWEAGMAGIAQIARAVGELRIDCDFRWTPGYLHAAAGEESRDAMGLRRDAQLAAAFGLDAQYLESVPGVGRPGVRFGGQACFHPRKYARALIEALIADGGEVFEHSALEAQEPAPARLRINGYGVSARFVVIATHAPLLDGLRDRLALYTSYVLAARLPPGTLPAALYWDTGDPYEYLRIDPAVGAQCATFGGADLPSSSDADPEERFAQVDRRLRKRLPDAIVTHRWYGQLVQTDDGLPFVGENQRGEFVATGFCGNGFTLGTVAAMMARDACLGRSNPWGDLFALERPAPMHGLWRAVTRNLSRLTAGLAGQDRSSHPG